MQNILNILSSIFVIALVALFSLKTLFEILGIKLPRALSKHRDTERILEATIQASHKKYIEIINASKAILIDELTAVLRVSRKRLSSFGRQINYDVLTGLPSTDITISRLHEFLERSKISGKLTYYGQLKSNNRYKIFYNLRGFLPVPDLCDELAQIIIDKIKNVQRKYDDKETFYSKIAVPREGSPLLGYEVAKKLGVECVLVSKEKFLVDDETSKQYCIDGDINAGDKVLIIDDSTETGGMLIHCAKTIRDENGEVEHVFLLFHRMEKYEILMDNCRQQGLILHSCCGVNDDGQIIDQTEQSVK